MGWGGGSRAILSVTSFGNVPSIQFQTGPHRGRVLCSVCREVAWVVCSQNMTVCCLLFVVVRGCVFLQAHKLSGFDHSSLACSSCFSAHQKKKMDSLSSNKRLKVFGAVLAATLLVVVGVVALNTDANAQVVPLEHVCVCVCAQ